MQNIPKISLIIPAYNRAEIIKETIDSALKQTCPFHEVIVVDDASTDNTLDILKQYGEKLIVIKSEKVGVQLARNKGVEAACGEYITLCDSDDILSADYVETIGTWVGKNLWCDSIYSNFNTFRENSTDPDKFSSVPNGYFDNANHDGDFIFDVPDLYGKTMIFQPLFSSGVTIKKAFYQQIGGYDSKFNGIGSEDWEYTLRALDHGKTALCTRSMVRIRRHAGNDSGNSLRQVLGEIYVLEYALRNHRAGASYRDVIARSLNRRRVDAFALAFGLGKFDLAAELLPKIAHRPKGLKFLIKTVLIGMYALPGKPAMLLRRGFPAIFGRSEPKL